MRLDAVRPDKRWSPGRISRALKRAFPETKAWLPGHETIYRSLYRNSCLAVARDEFPVLRTGRRYRKAHRHPSARRQRLLGPMRSIHDRPIIVNERVHPRD